MQGKTVAHSRIEMTEMVLPGDSNMLGNLLGGKVMHWIDLAAAMTAHRHAGRVSVTASMDSLEFMHPVKIGQVVHLTAQINWAGRTSMEIGVDVFGEDLSSGDIKKTSTAFLTFVSLDEQGKPVPVPPLILSTPAEHRRFQAAELRRTERLARRHTTST